VFATDVRHEQHQRQFQEKLKQWKEREATGHKHMASVPVPNFSRPFQVKRSTKPLTKTEDFVFHSEIRSLERKMAEDERKLQQNLEKTIKRRKTGHRVSYHYSNQCHATSKLSRYLGARLRRTKSDIHID
jgi:predicted oxidoreductase